VCAYSLVSTVVCGISLLYRIVILYIFTRQTHSDPVFGISLSLVICIIYIYIYIYDVQHLLGFRKISHISVVRRSYREIIIRTRSRDRHGRRFGGVSWLVSVSVTADMTAGRHCVTSMGWGLFWIPGCIKGDCPIAIQPYTRWRSRRLKFVYWLFVCEFVLAVVSFRFRLLVYIHSPRQLETRPVESG